MAADIGQGLWDFALRLYGARGVGKACLLLQDESGVDVPVLLFSAWLAKIPWHFHQPRLPASTDSSPAGAMR